MTVILLPILTFTLIVGAPSEYHFIYPPYPNSSFAGHHHHDPSTYHLQDIFGYGDTSQCKRNATCVPLRSDATCFGVPLPYGSTSLDLIPGYVTQSLIKQRLGLLDGLKSIPKCWSVVRPFMCSLFMPKCANGTVERISQSMCTTVLSSCRLMLNQTIWPKFVSCDNDELFMSQCPGVARDLKFNKTWLCPSPLVPTNNSAAIFEGIDGCGIPCRDPLYTHEEHQQIRTFITWGATASCILNFFAVITFLIDWKSSNKFPASVIFYINGCFMICCLGWLVQFSSGDSDVIVCRHDGTLRKSEPNGDLACVMIFILVYYPLMSAIIWFVILTYTWHISIQPNSKINSRLDKKSAYFHLLAWCVPLMLTVGVMGMSVVDGDSMTGVCFVGRYNYTMRWAFVLGPVLVAISIGGYFLVRGLARLIRLTVSSDGIVTEKASSKLRDTIVRMGLFSVAVVSAVVITVYCHMYDFQNYATWQQSIRNFIVCSITSNYSEHASCKIESRPSVTKLQLHLFALFFTGIVMSSWVWTSSSLDIWLRFVKRLFNREVVDAEEPLRAKKHDIIAQAYNKKQCGRELFENGRLSVNCFNDDPAGLNFDPNSVTSQDFSATWIAALPRLVERRGATGPDPESLISFRRGNSNDDSHRFTSRRSSNDSSYSFSLRRVSIESRRRNSNDSQFAVSISEMTAHGQLPSAYRRKPREEAAQDADGAVNKRRKRRAKARMRRVRGYRVPRSRRIARTSAGSGQDTPAIDTD